MTAIHGEICPDVTDWVRCAAQDLEATVDRRTLERGVDYARAGQVASVHTAGDESVLFGVVRGRARSPYHVLIQGRRSGGRAHWGSSCTCPVGLGCKHAVAVLAVAGGLVPSAALQRPTHDEGRGAPAAGPSDRDWRQLLQPVADSVESRHVGTSTSPVALLVEWDGGGLPRHADAVTLRPVQRGASGRWIRTGISWTDVHAATAALVDPERARRAVRAIVATAQAARAASSRYGHYGVGYADGNRSIRLTELGSAPVALLRDAAQAGFGLVTAATGERIEVSGAPAELVIDVRRQRDGGRVIELRTGRDVGPVGDLEVEVAVRHEGRRCDPAQSALLGTPPRVLMTRATGSEHPAGDGRGHGPIVLAAVESPEVDLGSLRSAGPIRVPADDVDQFLTTFYPAVARRCPVISSDDSCPLPELPHPRMWVEATYGADHSLTLEWGITYGTPPAQQRFPLHGQEALRDAAAEADLVRRVAGLLGGHVPTAIGGRAAIGPAADGGPHPVSSGLLRGFATAAFTTHVLPQLQDDPDVDVVVVGEPADYRRATTAPTVIVGLAESTPGATDWFDLDVAVEIDGESVPFRPLFSALATGEPHLLLESGTWFDLDRPELERLRRLIEEARSLVDHDESGLRISRWQAGLWEEFEDLATHTRQCESWAAAVGGLLDATAREPIDPPLGLRAVLRPYQLDGFRWLSFLWDHGLGGILADDMGLGKTVQALAAILRAKETGALQAPALVVAPTSVLHAWCHEVARFAPDLRVVALTETAARRRTDLAQAIAEADLVVTSYAIVRIDRGDFEAQAWGAVFLDEAQAVKNPRGKTHQVIQRLTAPVKVAITGTPLENSLVDLWALLAITAPGLFPKLSTFTEVYRTPIEKGTDPDRLDRLHRRVRPLMLRRTKEAVAPELPPKQEQVVRVDLHPAHRRVYDRHLHRERQRVLGLLEDFDRNRMAILRALTTLRQMALAPSLVDAEMAVASTKVEVFAEQIASVAAEGHRALVFSQFTGFLRLVRERLDREGIDYCYLDGKTTDRQGQIEEFRTGSAPVFLISLKAGGFGLTLTEADYVFVLDPWWNPAAEAQAVDRTHRIGQDKTVMVYRLIAADTIEDKVVALQERKRDLFARVVDRGGAVDGALTADDIRGLLEA